MKIKIYLAILLIVSALLGIPTTRTTAAPDINFNLSGFESVGPFITGPTTGSFCQTYTFTNNASYYGYYPFHLGWDVPANVEVISNTNASVGVAFWYYSTPAGSPVVTSGGLFPAPGTTFQNIRGLSTSYTSPGGYSITIRLYTSSGCATPTPTPAPTNTPGGPTSAPTSTPAVSRTPSPTPAPVTFVPYNTATPAPTGCGVLGYCNKFATPSPFPGGVSAGNFDLFGSNSRQAELNLANSTINMYRYFNQYGLIDVGLFILFAFAALFLFLRFIRSTQGRE